MASLLRTTAIIILFLSAGAMLGMFIAQIFFMQYDLTYKNTAIVTCEYANKMTDVLNNQSSALEKCMNKPDNDLVRINKLNCSLLR
jgi:hypothetical protein